MDGILRTMNSREPSDLPSASSYPPSNSAQVGQGAMYYGGRQLTADEILTAELSRDANNNLGDGTNNGMFRDAPPCVKSIKLFSDCCRVSTAQINNITMPSLFLPINKSVSIQIMT